MATREETEAFIAHYASQYYDPAKAREYYLRTRELKGRRGRLKTEAQRTAWSYAKNQIKEARTKDLGTLSESHKQTKIKLRETAKGRREEIREKLKLAIEKLVEEQRKDREAISEDTKRQIAALPPIPKGISSEDRERLALERREKIAQIRGEGAKDRDAASTQEDRDSERETAQGDREKVRVELKARIDEARETYNTLKETLKAKYETEYQNEYEAIRSNV